MNRSALLRRVSPAPNRVYWLCVGGVIAWAVLRGAGVDRHAPPIDVAAFLVVCVVAAANLAVRLTLALRRDRGLFSPRLHHRLGWLFVFVDFVCVAAGLRFSGGLDSAIWVVAFVVVSGETLLERRREAAITRAAACAALIFGTVPWPLSTVDWPAYALEMVVRSGLIIAVSSVNRRLRERSDTANVELANARSDLALSEQRSYLSREIHDGVGNSLAAAVLRLELAARLREKSGDRDSSAMLKEEAAALRSAMNAVRDWTFHNRPWLTDDDRPGSQILRAEVERLARRTSLPIALSGEDALDMAPPPARIAVLRIAQEALTNAAKHAPEAGKVDVTLRVDGRVLTFTITDDGPGFDLETCGAGVGLSSMRERALALGGDLAIESAPGHGTKISLRLPIR